MENALRHTVAVTGASKGIGRALAVGLSRRGWRVALIARNEEGLYNGPRFLDHPIS